MRREVLVPQLTDDVGVREGGAHDDELGEVALVVGPARQEHGDDRVAPTQDRGDALAIETSDAESLKNAVAE